MRDRASYGFALVSVAAALDRGEDGVVRGANLVLGGGQLRSRGMHGGLGGVLTGNHLDDERISAASRAAVIGARGYGLNDFKVQLAQRSVTRALQTVRSSA